MPLLECRILKIHSFPHFSLTHFDILSWNFAFHFILLYYRSSSSVFKFCRSYAPFGTKNTGNTQFSTLFSYMLWHIGLKFYIWLCFTVLQIKFECCQFPSIFDGVIPLLECRILKIHSFPHFSLTRFDILSWNFAYDFVLLYYRLSLSVLNLRWLLWELCPFGNLNTGYTQFSVIFSYVLWHIELKLYIWLCLMYKRSSSSVITLCLSGFPSVHPFSAFPSYIHQHI